MANNPLTAAEKTALNNIGAAIHPLPDHAKERVSWIAEGMALMASVQQQSSKDTGR